jgi:hypothetical protein
MKNEKRMNSFPKVTENFKQEKTSLLLSNENLYYRCNYTR